MNINNIQETELLNDIKHQIENNVNNDVVINKSELEDIISLLDYKNRLLRIKDGYIGLVLNLYSDYDGCDTVDSLKSLIDENSDLLKLAITNDDKTEIYMHNDKSVALNILFEPIVTDSKVIDSIDDSIYNDYKLCYIDYDGDESYPVDLYFTPLSLNVQSGDDWDDKPYEHNARKSKY